MVANEDKRIEELVAEDYRTAIVFDSFGIDFCCLGQRSIGEACEDAGLDTDKVIVALEGLSAKETVPLEKFSNWPIDFLADYIENKHHHYTRERIPLLLNYLNKLCRFHGNEHPELLDVYRTFCDSASDLTAHLLREELVLFPHIRKMIQMEKEGRCPDDLSLSSARNKVLLMMEAHEAEEHGFQHIGKLTSGYCPPKDACNIYKVTYALLDEFEKDLHDHIYLENVILFPKAIAFERKKAC